MRRRRAKSAGLMERYTSDGGLTLTSMMDILTTLLFFVLKSYVSGGEVTVPVELLEPRARPQLGEARDQMDDLDRRRGEPPKSARLATIQGDADIEFRVLQRVMYTLDRSGFPDIALAVLKKA